MKSMLRICTCAAMALAALPVSAQESGLAVQQFAPAPGGDQNYTHVHGAGTLGSLKPSFGLFFNYASRPLELTYEATGESVDLLRHHLQADLLAAIGLGKTLQIGLGIPLTLYQAAGDSDLVDTSGLAGRTLGDVRFIPKWKPVGGPTGFGLALEGVLTIPTGSPEDLQGNANATFQPRAILEYRGARLRAGLNAGYLLRQDQILYNLVVGNEVTWGAGLGFALVPDRVTLLGEAFGRVAADGDAEVSRETVPLEANLALRFNPARSHAITLGGGPGLSEGYGTPTYRVFLGYAFAATAEEAPDRDGDGIVDRNDTCPKDPEDRDGFQDQDGCPDPDNDGDELLDANDRCPDKAEDKDGFQDEDGCPDPDNDGDGVSDADDKCPTELEDRDGFQDGDGCPDPDNDGDGLLDANDKCPNDPEDKDDLGDEDGCPEPDFDKDGVPDVSDKCPRKPEVINGVEDEDGCPDKGESKVQMKEARIEILDKVYFDTDSDVIQARSHSVLRQVAALLKANTQITKLRIDGHTDSVADEAYNLDLSQRRTEAVRKFLIEQGIAPERLEAKGFGETRAIAGNSTEEGRSKNRRVEFTILEIDGKPVGQTPEAAPQTAPQTP